MPPPASNFAYLRSHEPRADSSALGVTHSAGEPLRTLSAPEDLLHDENESPPTGLGNLGYAPLGASSESSSRLQSMIFSPDLIRRSVAVYPTIGLRDFPGDWSFTSINHFGY